jgi:hypothetical protein
MPCNGRPDLRTQHGRWHNAKQRYAALAANPDGAPVMSPARFLISSPFSTVPPAALVNERWQRPVRGPAPSRAPRPVREADGARKEPTSGGGPPATVRCQRSRVTPRVSRPRPARTRRGGVCIGKWPIRPVGCPCFPEYLSLGEAFAHGRREGGSRDWKVRLDYANVRHPSNPLLGGAAQVC